MALSLQPQYAPAYRGLGQVFEGKGDPASAVTHYQKAVSLEGLNPAFASDVTIARFRLSQLGDSPEIATQVREHYQKAATLLKAKKKEEALKEFLFVLDRVPKRLDALENAAVILSELGRADESIALLRRIVSIDPNLLFAHFLLGAVEESQGKIAEAWEEFHLVLQIGEKVPNQKDVVRAKEKIDQLGATKELAVSIDSRLKMAAALYEKDDLEPAEKEFQEILQIVPANIRAKFGLASIDYKKEKLDEAKKLLLEVTEKDPLLVRGHFFLGKIFLKEKEFSKAFDAFNQVIELGKVPVYAQLYQSQIEEAKKDIAQMGGDVSRAQQIQQLLNDGNEFYKREDFDHAVEKYNQVLAISPDNLLALEKIGSVYIRESSFDPEKGEAIFKKMIEINPELLFPRFYLAFLADKKGDLENAVKLYEDVIQFDKKESEITLRAKRLLTQMGGTPQKAKEIRSHLKRGGELVSENKLSEARNEYQKVLEIVPEQTQALYFLGLIDVKEDRIPEAEKNLQKLLIADPNHLEGRLQLALLLGGRGAYEESLKELEKVIEIGKEGKSVRTAKTELDKMKKKAEGQKHFTAGMDILNKLDDLEKASPSKEGEPMSADKLTLLNSGIKELEEAIRFNQDNPYYLYNLGYAYVKKFDLVSAEFMFRKAAEKKPDFLVAHFRLAVLYDLANAPVSALNEYEKVIELGKPEDDEVKQAKLKIAGLKGNIGIIEEGKGYAVTGEALFLEQNDKAKALPLLKKSTELVPKNEDYWFDLGILYETLVDEKGAESAYESAVKIRPTFSKPRFYLGLIQEKRGQREAAIENFRKAKEYLGDEKSKEALLIEERVNFYDKKINESISYTPFYFDSNSGDSDIGSPTAEIFSSVGFNMKYFYYKSLNVLLSSDISASASTYYYSQALVNFESASFEAKWPDLHGLSIVIGPAWGISFAYGGMSGWNGQFKADFQEQIGWFDAVITHLGYNYSISVSNSYFDAVRKEISWALIKNKFRSGSLTAGFGLTNSDVIAPDDCAVGWNASATYSRPLVDYLSGSISASIGQTYFRNPDQTALKTDGLGEVYRKNNSFGLSGSLIYPIYKNVNLSASLGYQAVRSNLRVQLDREVTDILSKQTSPIGSYSKITAGFSFNYFF